MPVGTRRVGTRHGATLPALVSEQVGRTPEAIAVLDEHRSLTYAELARAADRLAAELRRRGVGPECPVGVCLPRSVLLAVALLAVWKAGGAFVPLDPDHPRPWVSGIARTAGLDLVLTESETVADWRRPGLDALAVDADHPAAGPEGSPVDPANAAYIIFTSGSTGTPKGVVIPHEGIANRVRWTVEHHGLGPEDRVLQKTVLTFDAAVWEFFAPLISGGTVVMAAPGAERDPALLVEQVRTHRVSVLQVVPSVLRTLVREPGWSGLDSLRLLFCAGEPLRAELCQQAWRGTGADIWNTYGPTECSIDVSAAQADPARRDGGVPIGAPLDNITLQVADEEGELATLGVPGELLVAGRGLARGYLGRPDLTAERFVPDPYGPPGSRRYRTGDLVRWNDTGLLEYQGRIDDQIKVNGVRVEPGTIESALLRHPAVTAATVGVHEGHGLTAHLVSEREVPAAELRAYLAQRLPTPMIPAVYVRLDALPMTSSGKVDRRALAVPVATTPARPRTPTELVIASVWSDLLGVDQVGAEDDFFGLGGSSLQLTRLAAGLREATGVRVAVADLFVATTPRGQAELCTGRRGEPEPIERSTSEEPSVLSFGQERLWVLDRLRPGGPEWLVPLFVRLPAEITVATVRAALRDLLIRHETLRTRYVEIDGAPRQVVSTEAEVEPILADTPRELVAELLTSGFDLESSPVVAAGLAPLPDGGRLLVLAIHHIACDGVSGVVLEHDLRELCAARQACRRPRLEPVAVRYRDFAVWQRERLTPELRDKELSYWRAALDGIVPLEPRTDRPRPAVRDALGGLVSFTVPGELADAVIALGRAHGVSPFGTLLTAYAVLLHRHTGQSDLTVGCPVAGRDHPDVAATVGFFLNVLVMRCDLAGGPDFAEALRRVSETVRAALAHQSLPFERLVEELAPNRDLSRTPLYQAAFDYHEHGRSGTAVAEDDLAEFIRSWRVSKTDISLIVHHRADGAMDAVFEYPRALFDETTVRLMAEHFVTLLAGAVGAPGTPVHLLPLSTATTVAPPAVRLDVRECPSHRFERHADTRPDAVAISFAGTELSYAEVNARADRIAAHLGGLGVGRGSLVGVCVGRGLELVPALLGVHKAGAAYVPLDPAQPRERLRFIVADADVRVVLTDREHREFAESLHSGRTVVVTDVPAEPVPPVNVGVRPEDLCYVIHTSGSTGRPKGVPITHGQVSRLFDATEADFGFGPRDVWTLFHSYAFDFSVWEIWGALAHGGRLEVVPAEVVRAPSEFLDLLVDRRVTVLNQTPSAFSGLVALAAGDDPRCERLALRTVVFGGERLDLTALTPWVDRLGLDRPELVNMYGITEITVHATHRRLTARDWDRPTASPIGRPLRDLCVELRDDWGNPVPPGLVGEIHIAGAGVAVGYLGRDELTAQRFPVGPDGRRWYRSGDLARGLPDGSLEFHGRADDQIKIRGHRIEPGEIEAALLGYPAIRECVVLAEEIAGDPRLVAYCLTGSDVDADGLTRHCAERLPAYMVPARFHRVQGIPLTANGKLDRVALCARAGAALTGADEAVPPRTSVEELIAGIWVELLDTECGVHDDFFSVGGHSLLVVRLAGRLREEFDVAVSVREIFECPTIARLAALVEAAVRAEIEALNDHELCALTEREG